MQQIPEGSTAGVATAGQLAPAPASGPGGRGGLRRHWALLAALGGGAALAAAFPPVGIWPLAAVGPALLVIALYRQGLRASFVIGLVFGIAFFVPLLSWLVNVAWYAWAALAIAEAAIFGLLAVGQRLLLGLPGWPLAVGGWWVAAEAMRARWPYAFPWGRLAMSQAGAPTAGWAAIGGPPLLSFLVAVTGAMLAWLVLRAVNRAPTAPRASARPAAAAACWPPRRPRRPSPGSRWPAACSRWTGPGQGSASRRWPRCRVMSRTPGPCRTCCGPARSPRTTRPRPGPWPRRSPRAPGPRRTW